MAMAAVPTQSGANLQCLSGISNDNSLKIRLSRIEEVCKNTYKPAHPLYLHTSIYRDEIILGKVLYEKSGRATKHLDSEQTGPHTNYPLTSPVLTSLSRISTCLSIFFNTPCWLSVEK